MLYGLCEKAVNQSHRILGLWGQERRSEEMGVSCNLSKFMLLQKKNMGFKEA